MNDANRPANHFRRLWRAAVEVAVTTLVVGALGWMGAHYAGIADEVSCRINKFWHPDDLGDC